MTAHISDRYIVVQSEQPETHGKYILWDKYAWEFVDGFAFVYSSDAAAMAWHYNRKQTAKNNILVEFSRIPGGGSAYDIEYEDIHEDRGRVSMYGIVDAVAARYFLRGVLTSWGIEPYDSDVIAGEMMDRAVKEAIEINREEIRNGRDDL